MHLKDTLNLPQTDFSMRASLVSNEPERIAHWARNDLYKKIQEKTSDGKKFILHDGPPFTNGDVHIGTALNKILKDIIIRYKTTRGFNVPYVPGWDCHGLPIEHKVMTERHKKCEHLSAIEIRKECSEFSRNFSAKQRKQFERLEILADWDHEYRTMDPQYEGVVLKFFADCVEQGLVYRKKKPVYWSIPCKTALADAEIEYKDHISPSIWVKFQFVPEDAKKLCDSDDVSAVIWTTTPWTIPSNIAIAVHPRFTYVIIEANGEKSLIGEDFVECFCKDCGIENVKVLRKIIGKDLEFLRTKHPFLNRESKIVLADYITLGTGTGCVHTAPGHGMDDYLTGLKYKLDIYCPIDDDGCYVNDGQITSDLVGVTVLDDKGHCPANDKVIEKLSACGALLQRKNFTHQYPHCWRSKTPIVFRAVPQWFISLENDNLREAAQNALNNVKFIPASGENRMRAAIDSRMDWCVSRQRVWGTPIPVFFDDAGEAYADAGVIRAIAEKISVHGSDYWFTETAEEILNGIVLPSSWRGKNLRKSTETLDVWIDSGNSHNAVLKTIESLSWPADLYLEGSDQHRGWFQSSLWTSVISNDRIAPYKNILTHGFIVGEDKKKISKSDGKPQTADGYVNKFGADVVRLWISSEDFRNDIPVSEDILEHVVSTYRTFRNTLRFQLGNLYDFNFEKDAVAQKDMTLIDKWALQKLRNVVVAVTDAYDNYLFHKVYQYINRFCSVELSAIYHDVLKDRLYTRMFDCHERRSSQTAIYIIFKTIIAMMTPITTFTCDEALSFLNANKAYNNCTFAQLIDWPKISDFQNFESEETIVDSFLKVRDVVNEKLEGARQNKLIGQSLDAEVLIKLPINGLNVKKMQENVEILEEMFIVSKVDVEIDNSLDSMQVIIAQAKGERCPRSWRYVSHLVDAGEFGRVSERCLEALKRKFPKSF